MPFGGPPRAGKRDGKRIRGLLTSFPHAVKPVRGRSPDRHTGQMRAHGVLNSAGPVRYVRGIKGPRRMQPSARLLAITPTHSIQGFSPDETVVMSRYPADFLLWHRDSYPALTQALLHWLEARQASDWGLPLLADLERLSAGPVGDFVNLIDVAAEDPMHYKVRRTTRAQRIRQVFRDDYVDLRDLPPLYRDHQLMSIFSAKGFAEPSFRCIQRTQGDGFLTVSRTENYVSLLLPCASRPDLRQPDRMLSVFDWLHHPEAPASPQTDRRPVPFPKADRSRR